MANTVESAAKIVAIEGLSEEQCELLHGIGKGSLLEFAVFSRPIGEEHLTTSEAGDEDEAGDVESHSDEGGAEPELEDDEGSEPEMPEPTESMTLESKPLASATVVATPDEDDAQIQDANAEAETTPEGSRPVIESADHVEDIDGGLSDVGSIASSSDNEIDAAHAAALASAYPADDAEGDVRGPAAWSDNGDDGDDGESEADHESQSSDDDEGESQDRYRPALEVHRELFVVVSVITGKDDNAPITDVLLRSLDYQHRGDDSTSKSYRIYGNQITLADPSVTLVDDEHAESLAEIIKSKHNYNITATLDPNGDSIRKTFFNHDCPGECEAGWLNSQAELGDLVDEELEDVPAYRPLCPVCLGKDLMNEQLMLKGVFNGMNFVDLGLVVEFLGRLNPARTLLGYPFEQLDEREWGYVFDDMLEEDEDGSANGDDGQYEQWAEAMDPNANPETRPAPKETLAALSRKTFAEVKTKKDDGSSCCVICTGEYQAESKVIELKCGHFYDEGCLEMWIAQYDSCPECRASVSGMVGTAQKGETDTEAKPAGETEEGGENNEAERTTAANVNGSQDDELQFPMDGDDAIMSDSE